MNNDLLDNNFVDFLKVDNLELYGIYLLVKNGTIPVSLLTIENIKITSALVTDLHSLVLKLAEFNKGWTRNI